MVMAAAALLVMRPLIMIVRLFAVMALWRRVRTATMAMQRMMAMVAQKPASARAAAVMDLLKPILKPATTVLRMPVVAAMWIVLVMVKVPPAVTEKPALN